MHRWMKPALACPRCVGRVACARCARRPLLLSALHGRVHVSKLHPPSGGLPPVRHAALSALLISRSLIYVMSSTCMVGRCSRLAARTPACDHSAHCIWGGNRGVRPRHRVPCCRRRPRHLHRCLRNRNCSHHCCHRCRRVTVDATLPMAEMLFQRGVRGRPQAVTGLAVTTAPCTRKQLDGRNRYPRVLACRR
jgi:hypothetical protein